MTPASESLRNRLKLRSLQSENLLKSRHSQAVALLESAGVKVGSIRKHAANLLAAGGVATTLLISPPQASPVRSSLPSASAALSDSTNLHISLKTRLKEILPPQVGPLSSETEAQISRLLHDALGLHATPQLEGNRLNYSYGLIGAEQHLPRFPGDTISQHDQIQKAGITPGRGAWGYFARTKKELTPDLIAKEKFYFAVQTLYLPDWNTRLPYLRDWYKHRKMVAVNPQNGKAVIGVVADSGPAWWTGKHFGGSPEIMVYLGLNVGKQKGPVIMFFIDDPRDEIALGPLEYNLESPRGLLTQL